MTRAQFLLHRADESFSAFMNQLLIEFPLLQVSKIAKDFHRNWLLLILREKEDRSKFH